MRLTALATVAVGLALAAASVTLVTAMSRSLVGDVTRAATTAVDDVAADLVAGRRPTATVPPQSLSLIQVQDSGGRVVQRIPDVRAGEVAGLPTDLPPEVRDARITARDEPNTIRPSDDTVLAWRTVSTPDGARTILVVSRLGPVTASVTLVVDALLVLAPLLTAFVGALTWFAVGRALRPVEVIRRRAEVISHSTLDERLPEPVTHDEVARLTGTLNEMLGRLDEGARRQREFVADASHELRTPLAAMRAELEVALRRDGDWPGVARRLLDDHRRLDRLTGDLLLLARLDDHPGPAGEQVRLDEIVAGELAEVRRVPVAVDLAPVVVTGVVPELTRLVRNLVDNADRHAASRLAVRLSARGGVAVLTVDDDGPGVPAAHRERVFDRFFRMDRSRARTSGGAGLGLEMVRRIARGHGGDATVGVAPLGGARFTVTLPLSQG
ncbi:signal transduction histidine kinase [Actinophytocola oryzae]|uniref:histidine kinase n=1 Tax=Actinophytocola oryzae TaxID=502181 RepID=A0A4R7URT3_9PSEU|nr:signal transduction histidine kinase [Actinophytocola oryzae]